MTVMRDEVKVVGTALEKSYGESGKLECECGVIYAQRSPTLIVHP